MTHPDAPEDIRGLERIWPEPGFLSLDELREDYARTWPDASEGSGP